MLRLLPAFVFFILLKLSHGQSIYSLQQDDSVRIQYSVSAKADSYGNQILKQLALAHLKIPEKTSFVFYYNYGASVGFQQDNMLEISASLTPSVSTGDVRVRDFDLQELLVPSFCALKVSLVHPARGTLLTIKREHVTLLQLMAGITVDVFPDSLWAAGCRLDVGFYRFGFDETAYGNIAAELNAIRDYYAASALADSVERRIRKVRTGLQTPVEAFREFVFLDKCIRMLNQASRKETGIIPGADPAGLLKKVPVAGYQFNDLLIYLSGGGITGSPAGNVYLSLSDGFGSSLKDALELSQRVDYYSSPFYYRLFSNGTSAGQLRDAAKLLGNFASKRRLKKVDLRLLSWGITDEIIGYGEHLMQEGRYAEALDLLNAGNRFCRVNPAIFVPQRLISAEQRARSGLTASYVRIVQKALDHNLPGLADKYLTEAMKYAGANGMTAADSAGFAGLYGVLTGKNLQTGYQFLNERDFQSALPEFEKAVTVARQFNLTSVIGRAETGLLEAAAGIYLGMFRSSEQALEEGNTGLAETRLKDAMDFAENYPLMQTDPVSVNGLRSRIALVKYNSLLNNAAELARVSSMKPAVEYLQKAAEISRDNGLSHTAFYDSLVMKAGVFRVNELLSESRLKLWAGDPEAAYRVAGEAMQLVSSLGLNSRSDIREQYQSLMKVADESLCSRVKGELASLINQADQAFSQNKFSEAAGLVFQAREIIYSRASCGLNSSELNQVTAKYQYPVRWNNMVKHAGELIASGDFLKGIEMMQQAGAVFTYYRLDTLGLVNTGLFESAMASGHIPFIRHAAGHYIARGGYDQALQLLEKLRLAGASPDETSGLQESLARVLAERDVAETEMLDLKLMLKIYTNGNRWYRRFSDVYKYHVDNQ